MHNGFIVASQLQEVQEARKQQVEEISRMSAYKAQVEESNKRLVDKLERLQIDQVRVYYCAPVLSRLMNCTIMKHFDNSLL
ncbi:hypothetical protein EON65_20000 [archaeon]|nr:MAG: hypothetical protein EON65_20000 [archaeon]